MEPRYAGRTPCSAGRSGGRRSSPGIPTRREGYRQAAAHAQDALALDPGDPWARMVSGLGLSTAGQHDRALGELRTALKLNPSFALGPHGVRLGAAARRPVRRGDRRDRAGAEPEPAGQLFRPLHHHSWPRAAGRARFEEALPFLRSSVAAFAEYAGHYNTLISCCGHLGLLEEARRTPRCATAWDPPLRLSRAAREPGAARPLRHLRRRPRKAGVPITAPPRRAGARHLRIASIDQRPGPTHSPGLVQFVRPLQP